MTYVPQGGDVGQRIRVAVRAEGKLTLLGTSTGFSPFEYSNASAPIVRNPPDNSSPPTFNGLPKRGQLLTLTSNGSWSNPTPTSFAPRWLRCNASGAACTQIPGAGDDSYRLTAADVGHTVRLRVYAGGPYGAAFADSLPTSKIVEPDRPSPPSSGGGDDTTTTPPTKKLTKLKPFPRVRVAGRLVGAGVLITRFVVRAPVGVKVRVKCRGAGCPYRSHTYRLRKRRVRLRALETGLVRGARLELRIAKKGRIGKYVRLRIRQGRAPARVDRCLRSTSKTPRRC